MPRASQKAAKTAKDKPKPLEGADEVPLPGQEWEIPEAAALDENFPVDDLMPHPDNPNTGDVDSIVESMDENGWYGTITAQLSTKRILAGEHRWLAAKQKGALTVPVYFVDVDDVTAIKILLADNATARRGVINRDKVTRLLEVVGDIRGTGIDASFLGEVAELDEKATKSDADKLLEPGEGNYAPQWGVIVACDDEAHQEKVFNQLTKLKLTVRAVSV